MKTMAPLQVETVNGQVAHTINNHQHSHTHQHDHRHQHQHDHHHTHIEAPPFALQAPPAPQARYRQRNRQVVQPITPAQKDLLAMMRPLPKPVRNGLLEWMRTEFGTGLVMELDLGELQRARQRVLDARRVAGIGNV